MIDPPSQKLMHQLTELQLCTSADLRRARGRVKRLARDLPAFDSIWLDALVQTGTLTPFQGRILEKPNGPSLKLGSWLLLDELSHGIRSRTYRAVNTAEKGEREAALKVIHCPQEFLSQIESRLEDLLTSSRTIQGRGLASTQQVFCAAEDQLAVVSPFVPGHHLGELLTRRGRFPAEVVLEIARQLIDAMVLLERGHQIHGDLRLSNVRLNEQGEAVLINVGIIPAITPEFVLKDHVAPDQYDGIAPELIGTGNPYSIQSDLYALGCLLWQLLAGRPPYPTGDPLAKLAAHQTKEISDVRLWAPDTPGRLAELIQLMTCSRLEERPHSFEQLQRLLGPARKRSRVVVRTFLKSFRSFVPTGEPWKEKSSRLYWMTAVLLIGLLGGGAVVLTENGTMPQLLEVVQRRLEGLEVIPPKESIEQNSKPEVVATRQEPGLIDITDARPLPLTDNSQVQQVNATAEIEFVPENDFSQEAQPLPQPDQNGRLYLTSNGPFLAPRLPSVGSLTIVGSSKSHPVILIEDSPALFSAVKLTLVNLHFRRVSSVNQSSSSLHELVQMQADEVVMTDCSFAEEGSDFTNPASAIAWRAGTPEGYQASKISLENCSFSSRRSAFKLLTPLKELQLTNCFKRGTGPLVYTAQKEGLDLKLSRSTFRGLNSLLLLHRAAPADMRQPINLDLDQTIVELAGTAPTLFGLSGIEPSGQDGAELFVSGYESFINENFSFALWKAVTPDGEDRIYEAGPDQWDGVMAVPLQFAGIDDLQPRSSQVLEDSFQGVPRQTEELPGMNPDHLPTLK
ncbi:MAG: protein kinase [Planctomycetaceae bacterium]